MTYIIHYVVALTLSLLGLQLQKPAKVESIDTFSRITEIIQSDRVKERVQIEIEVSIDKPTAKKPNA